MQAHAGLVRAAESVLRRNEEHEDLRKAVHRMETLVLELVRDVRALRDSPNGGMGAP